jgi:hypothetical protein
MVRRTFSGEEAVVEVEPSNHRSDVERAADRVELVIGSWDSRAYHRVPRYYQSICTRVGEYTQDEAN